MIFLCLEYLSSEMVVKSCLLPELLGVAWQPPLTQTDLGPSTHQYRAHFQALTALELFS